MTEATKGSSSSSGSYPIKTIVVLVQENRSFDHTLGWLKELNQEIDGVTKSDPKSNHVNTSDPNSLRVVFDDKSQYVDPDPGHSIQDIYEQVFGKPWDTDPNPGPATMSGFAQNAERNKKGMSSAVMNGFKPDALPVYKELLQNFAICDRWFASVPASTQPNRLFVHSGTSHGATSNDKKLLIEGFPQKTIFESLDEAGFSFGIYHQFPPSTLFYRNLRKLKYLTHFHQYGIQFKKDCKEGKLPNYVVIEQRWFDLLSIPANDDHPSHDVSEGQKLVKEVYEALRSSPQWNEILFIITYDEHGGFYDHVPTPVEGVPNPDGILGPSPYYFEFNRLGVRVPTFFISPWIEPGTVHWFKAIYEQVFGKPFSEETPYPDPKMNGFVQNAEAITKGMAEKVVMQGFPPERLPVFKELVQEFAVCDRWFSSLPSSTQPNRLYVHSATSNGAFSNDTNTLVRGFPQKTVFESLEESGFTFGIYYQSFPNCLFYRDMRKLKYVDNFHQYHLSFKRHCKEGKLPNYVVIEPRYFKVLSAPANDDHPKNDVVEGQNLVKEIYEALRASPQWNEILFVVVYDEHGGYYDHVPTPLTGIPNPDGLVGPPPYNFKFDRLGVRVPALLISPWIEPGTVLHEPNGPDPTSQFEHSSIPATLKKVFNLKSFLTKRDEWAGTFDAVINRTSPRTDCPVTLPEPPRARDIDIGTHEGDDDLTDFQFELIQAAAVIKGDHIKDIYPLKLAENMKVLDAAKYVEEAFTRFHGESRKAKEVGRDEHDIVDLSKGSTRHSTPKSFLQKAFSCLICDN